MGGIVTVPLYSSSNDEDAAKSRWIYTTGALLGVPSGLEVWALVRPYWLLGSWLCLSVIWLNTLVLLWRAVQGWKIRQDRKRQARRSSWFK